MKLSSALHKSSTLVPEEERRVILDRADSVQSEEERRAVDDYR